MTLARFQSFVSDNADLFRGVWPETAESLAKAEQEIGYPLPPSLKWLLSEWGYSTACAVASLEESVRVTQAARNQPGLPLHYIVLNDRQDAGVVLLDAAATDANGEYRVLWTGTHNIYRLAEGAPMDEDTDEYEDYPAFVLSELEFARDEVEGNE